MNAVGVGEPLGADPGFGRLGKSGRGKRNGGEQTEDEREQAADQSRHIQSPNGQSPKSKSAESHCELCDVCGEPFEGINVTPAAVSRAVARSTDKQVAGADYFMRVRPIARHVFLKARSRKRPTHDRCTRTGRY
jgi:hypothetical protein